jgi:sialic acid synthase SpsE
MPEVTIGDQKVGNNNPTYFIADISANHDGDLNRALDLISQCAEAGADAAKFQNFRAAEIVSDFGFTHLPDGDTHQSKWADSVFNVYDKASLPWEWTEVLKERCDDEGIHFYSSPYDFEAVDMLDPYSPAHKIGSGDVTWLEIIEKIALTGKPVILSTGAADIGEVQRAVNAVKKHTTDLILLQCNTNYQALQESRNFVNLRVLNTYQTLFPWAVPGISDHIPGDSHILAAIAMGARAVEKHFTDDNSRVGPDHPFSETAESWRLMVDRTREVESALGDGDKRVMENETDTLIVQRRCVRAAQDIPAGTVISRDMLKVLRPATPGAVMPHEVGALSGMKTSSDVVEGEEISWSKVTN